MSNEEINAAGLQQIENVFWRGVKAWARVLLPSIELKCDADLKIILSIKSVVAAVSGELETAGTEPNDDHHAPSDVDMLATILPLEMYSFMRCGTLRSIQECFRSL